MSKIDNSSDAIAKNQLSKPPIAPAQVTNQQLKPKENL